MSKNNHLSPQFKLRHRFGWLRLFPLVLLYTLYLKFKNRKLNQPEKYLGHQKEFFKTRLLEDQSDKWCAIREKIARYSYQEGNTKKVLEVATGHGYQAAVLAEIGIPEVVAIDIVPERIAKSRELFGQTNIDFRVMDAAHLTFPDKYFDCAVVSAALHDMPNQTKRQAISEMTRVTKNLIVIFEPLTIKNPWIRTLYGIIGSLLDESLNFRDYVNDNLVEILQQNRLKIVKDEKVWYGLMNLKVCQVT